MLDNTEYPEALSDSNWKQPAVRPTDGSKDVIMKIRSELVFTSNDKYYAWTVVFMIILAALGIILLGSLAVYCRMNVVYNRYAKERKEMKQLLLKMKDNEYSKFLMQEKESMKSKSQVNSAINRSVSETATDLDEDSD